MKIENSFRQWRIASSLGGFGGYIRGADDWSSSTSEGRYQHAESGVVLFDWKANRLKFRQVGLFQAAPKGGETHRTEQEKLRDANCHQAGV